MTTPTIRAALGRLVELYNADGAWGLYWDDAIAAARAALAAEPVGEGPSERIVSIAKAVQECAFAHESDARLIGNVCAEDVADLCDAVIDGGASPAAPPAPEVGEVGELVAQLEEDGKYLIAGGYANESAETRDLGIRVTRAAALLQQFSAPPAPEPGGGRWSEGICGDGAAILFDGVMVPIEEVVRALNRTPAAPAAPEVGRVAIPCNADIAAAMVPLGEGYLREHAPDRLRPATPAVPEPGEVGELADRLGWIAAQLGDIGWSDDSASVVRAATLLQQLAAPAPAVVPVAVAERPWEREGWCGKWGYCWRFDPCENGWWSYGPPVDLMNDPGDWTHMASHDAIPLPQAGEVEA